MQCVAVPRLSISFGEAGHAQTRAELSQWMHLMGFQDSDSTPGQGIRFTGAARYSPGMQQDEKPRQELHLVATHGRCHRSNSEGVSDVPTVVSLTPHSTSTPLGMAVSALESYSPRFRWPFQRIYVPCARGRTLQMDGCAPHAINHLCKNNRETTRIIFANHGLPHKVVTDNGPSFTSAEFRDFMTNNGIVHIKSAPYHPATNGLAERAVQTFKKGISRISGGTVQEKISKFLFMYRVTPHSVTGVPLSELLHGRRLRCRLDNWYPDISQRVGNLQDKQKQTHDKASPQRSFSVGDLVFAENFTGTPPRWLPGTVVMVTGPLLQSTARVWVNCS